MKNISGAITYGTLVFWCLTLLPHPSISGEIRVCSKQESQNAENITSKLATWASLYSAFEKYGHCDDGAIGEGFSESISLLLSDKWNRFDRFAKYANKNQIFREFVIKHIDETLPEDRLNKIKLNASKNCKAEFRETCFELIVSIEKIKGGS